MSECTGQKGYAVISRCVLVDIQLINRNPLGVENSVSLQVLLAYLVHSENTAGMCNYVWTDV